ncbi:hypothetical protein RI367_001109 [Sorochytrium milnesiophthora]
MPQRRDVPAQSTLMLYLRLLPLLALVVAAAGGLYLLTVALPPLDDKTTINLHVSNLQDIKVLAEVLQRYSATHFVHVFSLFTLFYLFKQTFSIPGSMALNLIAGALYGNGGTVLALLTTTLGASLCYLLSKFFGGPLVRQRFLEPRDSDLVSAGKKENVVLRISKSVARERKAGGLFFYLLFLRIFPFTPNWHVALCKLLNIASPHIGVPLNMFSGSVLLGLAPYNVITTQAGSLLTSLESLRDVLQPGMLLKLGLIAGMALLPVVLRKRQPRAADDAKRM